MGNSCADNSVAGGHYYVGDSDPWVDVIYTGAEGSVTVDYGSTPADADGRVLVLHNYAGGRMTCVIISNTEVSTAFFTVSSLGTYPTNDADTYAGEATVSLVDDQVTIAYSNLGGDSQCTGSAGSNANSCGIHIHSGTSCDTHEEVGGHYYGGDVSSDPWVDVIYTGADGSVTVTYGTTPAEAKLRALVVHDYSGARITCAIIDAGSEDSSASSLSFLVFGIVALFALF